MSIRRCEVCGNDWKTRRSLSEIVICPECKVSGYHSPRTPSPATGKPIELDAVSVARKKRIDSMTPSHDEKLVNEISEKLLSLPKCGDLTYLTIRWDGVGFWSFRQIAEDGVEPSVQTLARNCVKAAIREAIAETRKQTLEEAAKLAVAWANKCDDHVTKHFCDYFGCQSFDKLAAEIRLLSSPASTNSTRCNR